MDLWIRSQDKKKLIKAKDIQIWEEKDDKEYPFYIHSSHILIGVYTTEQKALEVLDKIEEYLDTNRKEQYVTTNGGGICAKETLIYEMPKN